MKLRIAGITALFALALVHLAGCKSAAPNPVSPQPQQKAESSIPPAPKPIEKPPAVQYQKTTTYDFSDDRIEGDLDRPDEQDLSASGGSSASSGQKRLVIGEITLVDDEPVERYPNIEAPDTVTPGQEIAVQVSLTTDQLAPETKILSGTQHDGKLQLNMAANEERWNITVNLTAPGMEFTRGGNTSQIEVTRKGDSTLAVFYLRPAASAVATEPRHETRILATLLNGGTFIARLSRPLTIVSSNSQPVALPAIAQNPAPPQVQAPIESNVSATTKPSLSFDPGLDPPSLTILENRVGNTLRLVFFTQHSAPVEADIQDPEALHAWIQSHYQQMAVHARGLSADDASQPAGLQHAADYINAFGSELYDKIAPQAFKDLFWKLFDNSYNHAPGNKKATWDFESIQVLSDDPAIPWELMRPARANGSARQDFLGLHFQIARWPLQTRGASRPPQTLILRNSAVIAPVYRGAQQLASANDEVALLEKTHGFAEITGNYNSVRGLAMHPPEGIVHFAGHGAVQDEGGVPQFAILLEDSQMDPGTWESLAADSSAHPLYFFNACDVGESRRFLNDVDGWAPMLLSSGASGYIGALWPVNDTTAEAVAASFYRHIANTISLTGANVSEALAKARAEVYSKTSDPTALAYVFYGDPNFTVQRPDPSPAH